MPAVHLRTLAIARVVLRMHQLPEEWAGTGHTAVGQDPLLVMQHRVISQHRAMQHEVEVVPGIQRFLVRAQFHTGLKMRHKPHDHSRDHARRSQDLYHHRGRRMSSSSVRRTRGSGHCCNWPRCVGLGIWILSLQRVCWKTLAGMSQRHSRGYAAEAATVQLRVLRQQPCTAVRVDGQGAVATKVLQVHIHVATCQCTVLRSYSLALLIGLPQLHQTTCTSPARLHQSSRSSNISGCSKRSGTK